MRDIYKPFVGFFIALLGSYFIHGQIKDLLPYPFVIAVIVFVIIYAGTTRLMTI